MGHSEVINNEIYQAPPAIMELVKVGRHLNTIDNGIVYNCLLSKCTNFCELNKNAFREDLGFNFASLVSHKFLRGFFFVK